MNYECYAYFCVNRFHNIYPIKDSVSVVDKILSLRDGDVVDIEGLGRLLVSNIHVDDYESGDFLFQEICVSVKNLNLV